MKDLIDTGDKVRFHEPPEGIKDLEYQVLIVFRNVLINSNVCVLIAPGENQLAAFSSELTHAHNLGESSCQQ